MGIPESQLETWSHQGSVTQSSQTYQSVKAVLESNTAPYANRSFEVFLQGSYGNDTNIYAESDVDIVVRLDSTFYRDISRLPQDQQALYKSSFSDATYQLSDFKNEVVSVLQQAYGNDVTVGKKAIQISARNGRRKTDVVVCSQFRNYQSFFSTSNQSFVEGIKFYTTDGVEIINYPKIHSRNLTQKHQQSGNYFKPVARIFKNMRSRMISERLIADGIAPSYYLEGLLYNVPVNQFGQSYENSVVNSINWLLNANQGQFVCANEQYYLCHPTEHVTWRTENMTTFLNGAVQLWNQW